jgi:acetylornithine deacetylase/succinyl-diaminopimelate desuccinylase-like protein
VTDPSIADLKAVMFPRARAILTSLVAEQSVAGNDAAVERCLEQVAEAVSPAARSMDLIRYGGPPVLVARFGPSQDSTRLAFSGHVDVVPATPTWDSAFTLRETNGRLMGRGVVDMKGAVAAFVAATQALRPSGILERCSLELVLTGDEEVGSEHGTIPVAKSGTLTARAAVCGEPTGLHVLVGNRGVVWLRVVIEGRGGHAGLIHLIDNATSCASSLAVALESLPLTARDDRFRPGAPSLTVTRCAPLDGLEAPNVVPESVELLVDRRLLPGEDPEAAINQIRECVRQQVRPPFAVEIDVLRRWQPYAISPEAPISRAAGRALTTVGVPVVYGTDLASNDASWLVEAGIPTVMLGPGEPEQAHSTGESLRIDELATACAVYSELIRISAEPER